MEAFGVVVQHAHFNACRLFVVPFDGCLLLPTVHRESRHRLFCYMSIPNYPDWPDVEMNLRHDRMMEIRHNFLGHSCIEGSKVILPLARFEASSNRRYNHDVLLRSNKAPVLTPRV